MVVESKLCVALFADGARKGTRDVIEQQSSAYQNSNQCSRVTLNVLHTLEAHAYYCLSKRVEIEA